MGVYHIVGVGRPFHQGLGHLGDVAGNLVPRAGLRGAGCEVNEPHALVNLDNGRLVRMFPPGEDVQAVSHAPELAVDFSQKDVHPPRDFSPQLRQGGGMKAQHGDSNRTVLRAP